MRNWHLPIFPLFPVGVFVRYSENFSHEPSAQSSLILSRVRDPFLKLDNKGTKKSVSIYAAMLTYFTLFSFWKQNCNTSFKIKDLSKYFTDINTIFLKKYIQSFRKILTYFFKQKEHNQYCIHQTRDMYVSQSMGLTKMWPSNSAFCRGNQEKTVSLDPRLIYVKKGCTYNFNKVRLYNETYFIYSRSWGFCSSYQQREFIIPALSMQYKCYIWCKCQVYGQ